MNKLLLGLVSCSLFVSVQSNWILESLYFGPESSLYAAEAYRIKNGKQKLTSLNKNIKNAAKKPVIVLHHRILSQVNQDTLCIVIRDQRDTSVQYELYLDSQSSASINADRSRIKKVFDIPAPKDVATFDGFYARAVLKQNDQIVVYTQQPYLESDVAFDVVVHATPTGFTLRLMSPEA